MCVFSTMPTSMVLFIMYLLIWTDSSLITADYTPLLRATTKPRTAVFPRYLIGGVQSTMAISYQIC